ncbi:MAG: Lipoprotein-releasing system ATP-binding protein LolD [Candidatus Heimdallarchaeota archaeon LC_3]|nr:MAG: Lipoprotein-releasing system ATP-binding protein LolD [Candidatus Heimdallarchaeota archaeon LC_3]
MAEYILEIKDLHKKYDEGTSTEVHALRGLSLTVKKGEMIAIMGPSGCGKSTLLNMIGGLDKFTSGELYINGNEINTLSDNAMSEFRAFNLGFIFQLFNLFDFLSATQNVMVPLLIQRIPKSRAQRQAELLLRELGLGGHLDHTSSQLSGGQQQRVAIARSLVTQPSILLGDEPTGDLDSSTASDIVSLFRRINLENKQTLVLVTHNQWIADHCDRTIRMSDGRVIDDGLGGKINDN